MPATSSTSTLRQTDFLPNRFSGDVVDRDLCTAHILTFQDYLDAHGYDTTNSESFPDISKIFKRSLQGQARLWIEGKQFKSFDDLKSAFVCRFSGTKSSYAHVQEFNNITFTPGESAEVHLQKIKQAAARIQYTERQVRDKFLSTISPKCRAAVLMSAPESADSDALAKRAQCFMDLETESDSGHTRGVVFTAQTEEINSLKEEIAALKLSNQHDQRQRSHSRGRSPNRHDRSAPRSRWPSYSANNRDRRDDSRGRSPYRQQSQQRRKPICDYCLIPGHVWRQCRKRDRDMEARHNPSNMYSQNNNQGF